MAAQGKLIGKMVIGQSGGPTVVINQSLVGAVLAARRQSSITGILGTRHGIAGIMKEDFIDLTTQSIEQLELVASTPAAALGSVRLKPGKAECEKVFEVFRKNDVRYFFYIGGNDSAETAHIIAEMAKEANYDFCTVHIPKTIDNDLKVTDHCPGFASAARFVALAFMGDDRDNRALQGIKVNVVMGRSAGFLTAASALARQSEGDGPHLIYLPERVFDTEKFQQDVRDAMAKYGRCDRSFPTIISEVDAREARAVGDYAVNHAASTGQPGSVAIRRLSSKPYASECFITPLSTVAKVATEMKDEYINAAGNDVTQAWLDYVAPLVGELPKMGRL